MKNHTERYCRNSEEIGDKYTKPLGNENFHKGGFWDYPDET